MSTLAPTLKTTNYYFDDRHSVLSDAKATAFGPNIAKDGRNLTIMFLSLNRSKLSIRLLDSIAAHLTNFAGEILIGDNGSDPSEIKALRAYLKGTWLRWRLLEFGKNLGVSGGRNRLMAEAKTDWVISLDNDIYFTANPLPQIQTELATLGCHFMSFPLLNPDSKTLFAHGACLQTVMEAGRPRLLINPIAVGHSVEAESADGALDHAFLCTFLFGGASILNRQTFTRLGGFDEGMVVGFEDIDMSLRLFREGMKIGTSAARFLIHDHPKAETSSDSNYEKKRYSRKTLFDSAKYLEAKTGFQLWGNDVENWMRESEQKQGWTSDGRAPASRQNASLLTRSARPRIALITDTADWAYANIARQLKRYLSDRFEFEIIPLVTLGDIEKSRWFDTNCKGYFADGGTSALGMALVATEEFDITHIFWREYLTIIDNPVLQDYAARVGMSYPEFRRRFVEDRILSTCVYDHLFLSAEDVAKRENIFTELTSAYYVSSERLGKIYEAIPSLPDPAAVLPDGVDLSVFKPSALDRFDTIARRPVKIGWVGHSRWASMLEDFKGVDSILKPAIAQLRAEGLDVIAEFADRKDRFIPHSKMPEYYAGIDVLVCTSKIEGTPNPVLEAMACGVPVITTDVGIVPQLFGARQRQYILSERSIDCLKAAIRRLVSQPAEFRELSRENLDAIKDWDWSHKAENFAAYFDGLLERGRSARDGGATRLLPFERRFLESGEARTKMCMLPFSSPSMEPDGVIRLCSASSIFAYYDQTDMGNCLKEGLSTVWTGERYRQVRKGLLTGKDLKPYCTACEYRFDAPVWLMQLHLGLHAYHSGVRTDDVLALIGERADRYQEYKEQAPSLNLAAFDLNDGLRAEATRVLLQQKRDQVPLEKRLAPASIIDSGKLPIYMDFNTLNRCNVSCTMCPPAIRHDKLGVKRDPYFRLTVDQYKQITNGAVISTAHFVGEYAEPLLNKDIFSLVSHAHGQGSFTAITTNAIALNRPFGERLLDAGLDMMTISLHGASAPVAESIMLKSNFKRIVENIRNFQQLKKERGISKPEIYFNYVTQKSNVHEMPAFVELAAELGVKYVNFIHLIDGDDVVDKGGNLLSYPELLVPNVIQAQRRAEQLGVVLYVSPAYTAILAEHANSSPQPTHAESM